MRVFVGIPVSSEIQSRITTWRESYSSLKNIRWIANHNLHITLIPPWNTPDLEKDIKNLPSLIPFPPFSITLETMSIGPSKKPHLIWQSIADSNKLRKLRIYLYRLLEKPVDTRPFSPHLTLARFRFTHSTIFSQLNFPQKYSWSMPVEKVVFYQSHLSEKGAEYQKCKEIPLSK